jgi:hypothetical protein
MLKHIVLLKLKPGVTAEQSTDLLNALSDLMDHGTIPGILHVSGGYNNSPEGKSKGYDWGFVMWFEDAAARDRYLPHPAHQELGKLYVAPICDDVAVFDFDCPMPD